VVDILGGLLVGLILAVLVFAAYVRLAPLNADRWHKSDLPNLAVGSYPAEGGFSAVHAVADGPAALADLDGVIRQTARTTTVGGKVGQGRVTYVTRSALWAFPDYTVVQLKTAPDGQEVLHVQGHLRFGKSDLGVNRKRIEGWLAALDAGA